MLVPGDVNSTLAVPSLPRDLHSLGHLEAGLRSFDRSMPEEQPHPGGSTQVTDWDRRLRLEDLKSEGLDAGNNVHFVGNTMIDTLVAFSPQIEQSTILADLKLALSDEFYLLTMHRPATYNMAMGSVDLIHRLQMPTSCSLSIRGPKRTSKPLV